MCYLLAFICNIYFPFFRKPTAVPLKFYLLDSVVDVPSIIFFYNVTTFQLKNRKARDFMAGFAK